MRELRRLYRSFGFFRSLIENLEMTLAKSSLEIARGYLTLVPADAEPERLFAAIAAEHERAVGSVLEVVEAKRLLDRHPVVQRSIELRNPYVDPMNAIQVDLLRRYREAATRTNGACAPAAAPVDHRGSPRRCGTPAERNRAKQSRNRFRRIVHRLLTFRFTQSYLRPETFSEGAAKSANIREVAKQSGVSVSTVSRVFNGYADVSAATRERVLAVARKLDYAPSAAARTLVKQPLAADRRRALHRRTSTPTSSHPFFQEVLVGLKHGIGELGYDLLLFATEQPGSSQGRPHSYVRRARHHGVDGVVADGRRPRGPRGREARRSSPIPVIARRPRRRRRPRASYVASDNVGGARLAVRHLHALGHTRIATIAGPRGHEAGRRPPARLPRRDAGARARAPRRLRGERRLLHARAARRRCGRCSRCPSRRPRSSPRPT